MIEFKVILQIALGDDLGALAAFHLHFVPLTFFKMFLDPAYGSIRFDKTLGTRVSLSYMHGRDVAFAMKTGFKVDVRALLVRTMARFDHVAGTHRLFFAVAAVLNLDVFVQLVEIAERFRTMAAHERLEGFVDERLV